MKQAQAEHASSSPLNALSSHSKLTYTQLAQGSNTGEGIACQLEHINSSKTDSRKSTPTVRSPRPSMDGIQELGWTVLGAEDLEGWAEQ